MNRMKYISGIVANVFLMAFIGMNTASCEDYLDTPVPADIGKEEVEVELALGFADEEDGYTVSGKVDTRSKQNMQNGAFCAELISTASTRAEGSVPDLKPDALYELYVLQYKEDGTLLKLNAPLATPPAVGTKLSYTLSPADDCQLVIIARGKGNTLPAISGNLSNLRKLVMANSIFSETNIPSSGATQEEANKMPYVLHLPHVKVTSDGKLQSVEGAYDARLLLKRLATRLTVNWDLSDGLTSEGYTLKEVKLCQVPADYRLLPTKEETEWGTTYPSTAVEFIDYYRLTGTELADANGSKTIWMPANVRGNSAKATSPYYRTKENAPTAASYVELVVDNSKKEERLYYRAYLGGKEDTDFNLYENTDYNWTVHINSANYQSDGRIQLLDQTPVKSTNEVETANCFMMVPGTNICFNPYKHGAKMDGFNKPLNGWNTYLTDGSTLASNRMITDVKVFWQVKDNATTGELVMGYAISKDNHSNLVRLTDGNDLEKARVHVKVPLTKGGNALIAAYSGSKIVWSWHLWITDYVPQGITSSITYDRAQQMTQNGSVHQYALSPAFKSGGYYANKVIMDRNLCATGGGFPGTNASLLEFARRIGYLYCWGRKDPFFGSVDGTANEIDVLYDGEGYSLTEAVPKMLYSKVPLTNGNSIQYTVENPSTFIKGHYSWFSGVESNAYAYLYNETKTLYDPCPAGWKAPNKDVYDISSLTINNAYWFSSDGTFKSEGEAHDRGGRLYNVLGSTGMPSPQTIHNSAWFPMTAFRSFSTGELGYNYAGGTAYQGTNTIGSNNRCYYSSMNKSSIGLSCGYGAISEPNPIRCVQE